jgi:hypothetical protein
MEELAKKTENVVRLVIAISGILYVIGFLVVAFYRSRFSLPAAGLLRSEYVLAGIWALLPFALITSLIVFATAVARFSAVAVAQQVPLSYTQRVKRLALSVGIWVSLAAVLLAVAVRFIPEMYIMALARHLDELYRYLLWPFGFTAFAIMGIRVPSLRPVTVVSLVFFVFTGFEYLIWFADVLYIEIPRSLGGGAPVTITLGAPLPCLNTKHLKLIAEDNDFLSILSGNFEVRAVRKSTIEGYAIHP